ncbi:MAG TPA: gluconolaconase [Microbacterium sp.]|nr:gluconolaconase [Planctomycetota bacterium]HAS31872.1 gluconolaconase [Microbacterium sp.]|tara:strand:+ start:51263 stop:52165 length:903 start_codon:yes stop_codon:yes gene_type:complete
MPRTLGADLAIASRNDLGESILWDDRTNQLSWVDIHEAKLERWSSAHDRRTTALPERIGAIGLRDGGGYVAAFASRFALLDTDGNPTRELEEIEGTLPSTRLNDGRTDRQGRFICGGMDESPHQQAISAVYRLDDDGRAHRIVDRVACANSIAFSPNGALMYFSDMPTGRILVYDYDIDAGIPHNPRLFADGTEHPGLPDGSTVDADGCLWNARWGDASVVRYAPDGRIDAIVTLPTSHPTCPVFGGEDLSTLFIASARFGLSSYQLHEEPEAGSIFAVSTGLGGIAEPRYIGPRHADDL